MDLFETITTGNIKPATSYKTTQISEPVKIRYISGSLHPISGIDEQPITIPQLFNETVKKYSNKSAIIHKDAKSGLWQTVTYSDYYKISLNVAKQFIQLGLKSNDCIGILASNCPEWFYAEMGAFFCGTIVAGVYTTNSPDAVQHALDLCAAKMVIVDDHYQMEKIIKIKHLLPNLKFAVQIHGPFDHELFRCRKIKAAIEKDEYFAELQFLKWNDLIEGNFSAESDNGIDNKISPDNVENDLNEKLLERLHKIAPNQCCLLIYTSGTVGFPKAVMLSHDNLITNARNAVLTFPNICYGDERTVSYLPLNHIVGQIFDVFITFLLGGCIYIAERDAMKGSLLKTIVKAKPTRFFGVPRVFEKMQDKLSLMENQNYGFLKVILNWAKFYASEHHLSVMNGSVPKYSARYWFAQNILTSIKTVFGLEKCKYFLTGGAPTSHDTKKFFLDYDIRLYEIYGLSETSGGVAFGDEQIKDFDMIGRPVDGIKFKVNQPNEKGYGEICVKSRSSFMGYVNEPVKTNETLDSEGWLFTGDLGFIDEQGYLYITGRIKEIVITSGGENVPPNLIEDLIKTQLPGISNAFLVGDRKKYLTILVTIKTETDTNTGAPLNALHSDALEWMQSLDLKYKTLSEIMKAGPCSKVQYSIADGIKRANMNAISNAQKVQKFRILPNDFSMLTGELGPTLKVKRNFVLQKYTKIIDEMYKE